MIPPNNFQRNRQVLGRRKRNASIENRCGNVERKKNVKEEKNVKEKKRKGRKKKYIKPKYLES